MLSEKIIDIDLENKRKEWIVLDLKKPRQISMWFYIQHIEYRIQKLIVFEDIIKQPYSD